jgi:Family of unknown function (DUF5681)
MPTDKNSGLKPPPKPTDYEVGYGKPPHASRFAPGQSGNRKGRPKGSQNKAQGPKENRLREIILAEAYRPIKMNEGKKRVTVPMAEAIVRSFAVSAARGQLRSQQAFTKMLAETEQARALQNKQSLEMAVDYKFYWGRELERRKSLGTTGPEPLPHPDDVHINVRTGEVTIAGPWTKEEKAEWDYFDNRVEEADRNIERLNAQLEKIRSKMVRAFVENQIADERAMRDMIVSRLGEPSNRRRS